MIGGAFSRKGYGARIAAVAVAALVTRTLGFGAQALAGSSPAFNVLQYLVPTSAALIAFMILFAPKSERRVALLASPA